MGHPKFKEDDFLEAAMAIIAEHGISGVTVASVCKRLRAPTGSFYHRFASRDILLGTLWLRAVLDFQTGTRAALEAGDGLRAALHTPDWVRKRPDLARVLLLYDRTDFLQGEWPTELRASVCEMVERMDAAWAKWSKAIFGRRGRDEARLAQFLISELPVAVVRQHLLRGEPPPQIIDRIIRSTYRATIADYHAGTNRQVPDD
jgi:AcrR family transcriptional regulator